MRSEEDLKNGIWEPQYDNGSLYWTITPETVSNPQNPYGMSKISEEMFALFLGKRYGIPSVAMRYSIVQGSRQSFYNAYSGACRIFSLAFYQGKEPPIYEDGNQVRDFVNIHDVVDANIKCAEYPLELNGDIFNIGNGDSRSVNEIADMIGGDRKHLDPVIEPKATLANNEKAKRILKFNPSMDIEDWMPTWKKDMGL